MNISNLNSGAAGGCQHGTPNAMQQRGEDFRSLAKAVKSGDLEAAKEAFAAFKETLKNDTSGRPDPFFSDAESQTSKDLEAVGKALESGDIAAAQEAFATLKQDMDSIRGSKMHGPPPPPPPQEEESSAEWQAVLDAATEATTAQQQSTRRTSFLAFA